LEEDKKKRRIIIVGLVVAVIIIAILGYYYLAPKKINIDIFPPQSRDSEIMIKVNDKVVYERTFVRNETTPVAIPDFDSIETTINGPSVKITVEEQVNNLEKEEEYSISDGNRFQISIEFEIGISQFAGEITYE
jgi:hypothetical protein